MSHQNANASGNSDAAGMTKTVSFASDVKQKSSLSDAIDQRRNSSDRAAVQARNVPMSASPAIDINVGNRQQQGSGSAAKSAPDSKKRNARLMDSAGRSWGKSHITANEDDLQRRVHQRLLEMQEGRTPKAKRKGTGGFGFKTWAPNAFEKDQDSHKAKLLGDHEHDDSSDGHPSHHHHQAKSAHGIPSASSEDSADDGEDSSSDHHATGSKGGLAALLRGNKKNGSGSHGENGPIPTDKRLLSTDSAVSVVLNVQDDPTQRVHCENYVKQLAKALASVGLPFMVVEFYVLLVGQMFGLPVKIQCVHQAIWLSFGDSTVGHLVKLDDKSSLSRMVDVYHVAEDVVRAKISPARGIARINRFYARPSVFPEWFKVPAHAVLAAAGCPLFNGRGYEVLTALFVGVLVGLLTMVSDKNIYISRGYEIINGAIASLLAVFVHTLITPIDVMSVVFGGVLWALPGLRIAGAMTDLSTGFATSGTAKFFSSLITCINLGIGIIAGLKFIDIGTIQSYGEQPLWVEFLAVIFCSFPVLVLLDGKPTHFGILLPASCISYGCATISTAIGGKGFGSWLGAFVVGILSNLYGRFSTSPAVEMNMFSIVMLVPGSFGLRTVLADDAEGTIQFFTEMITIAIAIVTGLFSANIFVPPIRSI